MFKDFYSLVSVVDMGIVFFIYGVLFLIVLRVDLE